ncbi:MAG TPA: glycosyltransferase family 2 protein [Thermodesulfobacteriota bacterium]|nr:glycosyltransferase family 2 protein [Thermodesulfobacteriota bacterium]
MKAKQYLVVSEPLPNIYLSVVIPAYNEAERIGATLQKINDYLLTRDYRSEVIVVDDGSTDTTPQVVRKIAQGIPLIRLLENGANRGKGYSVRAGMLNARGEIILFSDADLSTPIQELDKLTDWLNQGYDIAIGSRALPESDIVVRQPLIREFMGKTFNQLVQLLTISGIRDTQCGFKVFSKDAAKDIFEKQTIWGFSFDVEILFIARKSGYRIKEVPIRWINSPNSRVHIVKDSFLMLCDLVKIRMRYLMGKYRL